jgi:2-polyprenyl-6-methoxyphenol hydroxylase-like FAD-dependent oxidoreductase
MALLLAQKEILVTVLEKSVEIDRNPRASFYSLPTIYELRRAGLMEDIMEKAFVPDGVAWRYIDGTEICSLSSSNPKGDETMISLPLDELLPIMAAHVRRYPSATVLLDHEVIATGQDDHCAWVDVKTPLGEKRFEATYVVGCDGANSKIRKDLFGSSFPGFTWDKQIVACNVR